MLLPKTSAEMGDLLLVRVLLLLPILVSPSALLPELHQHIRGLVDRVDLLVDLVDIHSDLVGTGPFSEFMILITPRKLFHFQSGQHSV